MYCVFEDLFGLELADYLWGNSSPISINNQFIAIGFWMLGIALSIAIVYYYVINHPRLCNWWGWSIFAKVCRDKIMLEMDKKYPEYGYAKHKGYPTVAHREICKKIGPSPIQRKTFKY